MFDQHSVCIRSRTPGDLSKHFRRKRVSQPPSKEDEQVEWKLCNVSVKHRTDVQNLALASTGLFPDHAIFQPAQA